MAVEAEEAEEQQEAERRRRRQQRRPKSLLRLFPALPVPLPEATMPQQTTSRPRTGSGALTLGADARSRSSGEWRMRAVFLFFFEVLRMLSRRRCVVASFAVVVAQPCNFRPHPPFFNLHHRRLKVHYRAPPDIRGSGKERGHGTELQYCPRCGKELKAGKHHVGCFAGRSAPRQAAKRFRLVSVLFLFFVRFGMATSSVETGLFERLGSFEEKARARSRGQERGVLFLSFRSSCHR